MGQGGARFGTLDKVKRETGATVYRIGPPARGVRSRKAA
jgi:hypothetical protein